MLGGYPPNCVVWRYGESMHEDSKYSAEESRPCESRLTAEEINWIGLMAELIIPRTDTPGAIDANVPAAIAALVDAVPRNVERFRVGMAAVNEICISIFREEFDDLSAEQQINIMLKISLEPRSAAGTFFNIVKAVTVDCYYTSPAGLRELCWSV